MAKIDLKKVASEVLDGWQDPKFKKSLVEHDMHYHDGHYRGGKCLYRERLDKEDHTIDDLEDANLKESAIYAGRRFEGSKLESEFFEEFSTDERMLGQKNGCRAQVVEPDKDGIIEMKVWCPADTPNEMFKADALRKFFKDRGYELKTARAKTESGDGKRLKERKVLTFGLYRPENFQFAKGDKDDGFEVKGVGEGDLSDEQSSEALKKFGMKKEGGKVSKRTLEDNRKDRAKKYLGLVGDWEGQSTREDKASETWEKKRLQSLKKAQEDRKAEEA